jgi:hypothetical protein
LVLCSHATVASFSEELGAELGGGRGNKGEGARATWPTQTKTSGRRHRSRSDATTTTRPLDRISVTSILVYLNPRRERQLLYDSANRV